MHESDDMGLLREYAARGSEAAFEELVARRVGFVYSGALRQVRDPHQSEEITQAVFVILAQKAGRISKETNLTGWLFKTTRFVALAQQRAAIARRQREQEFHMQADIPTAAPDPVWELISPHLDEALMQLGEKDRQTVLMHYFDKKSFADIGEALGMSEVTARKRASRALEKLRALLSRRGVGSAAAVLAGVISANSVQAAPVGLALSISATAVKGPAVAASTTALVKGALKLMAWSHFKTAVVVGGILLLAGATASFVISQTRKSDSAASQRKVQIMPDRTTPKGTLLAMIDAMKTGDGKAYVESYLFSNADELKLKATLENVVNACAKFRQAIGKQFGSEAEEQIAANLPLVMPSEVIESAREKITGDSAEVTLAGGKSGPPAQFKRVNGEWKMTAEGLFRLSPAVQNDLFSRLVRSLNETASEIPQGGFKTADEAMTKMKERAR